MKRIVIGGLVLAIALPNLAWPAFAQDTAQADWEVIRDPRHKSVIAWIPVTTGLTLAVRCTDGALDTLIAGLPATPTGQRTRPLHIAFGDKPLRQTNWNVTTDRTVAIADYPAAFARDLRQGGALKIMIPRGAADGRNLRHDLELTPSSTAIEEVLTSCQTPLEDPRDALLPDIDERGLPPGMNWARAPRPRYPNTNYATGYAVVTCLAGADGSVSRCQVESQQPANGRFGDAALRAMPDARVGSTTEATGQITPRLIGFRVNFYLAGYEPRGTRR
ncbi:MAG: hypothetical protein EBR82_30805 [Caulobacteraceae bacterium]|nr:hypothetical protein [Caulobacteraceae bacterium]